MVLLLLVQMPRLEVVVRMMMMPEGKDDVDSVDRYRPYSAAVIVFVMVVAKDW